MNSTNMFEQAIDIITGCIDNIEEQVEYTVTHTSNTSCDIYITVEGLDSLYSISVTHNKNNKFPLEVSLYNDFEYDIVQKYKSGHVQNPLETYGYNPEDKCFEDDFTQQMYFTLGKMGKDSKIGKKLLNMPYYQHAEKQHYKLCKNIAKLTKVLPKNLQSSDTTKQLELLINHFTQMQNDSK